MGGFPWPTQGSIAAPVSPCPPQNAVPEPLLGGCGCLGIFPPFPVPGIHPGGGVGHPHSIQEPKLLGLSQFPQPFSTLGERMGGLHCGGMKPEQGQVTHRLRPMSPQILPSWRDQPPPPASGHGHGRCGNETQLDGATEPGPGPVADGTPGCGAGGNPRAPGPLLCCHSGTLPWPCCLERLSWNGEWTEQKE